MPKQDALKVYNTFVGGLVTESTPLTFPENGVKDTVNCIFDKKGDIRRRLGINYESSSSLTNKNVTESEWQTKAVGCFEWSEVAGDGSRHFLVVQVNATLYYFDNSHAKFNATVDFPTPPLQLPIAIIFFILLKLLFLFKSFKKSSSVG